MPQDPLWNAIFSLVPSILIGVFFWFIVRAIMRADRGERAIKARIAAEERAKAGLPPIPTP